MEGEEGEEFRKRMKSGSVLRPSRELPNMHRGNIYHPQADRN